MSIFKYSDILQEIIMIVIKSDDKEIIKMKFINKAFFKKLGNIKWTLNSVYCLEMLNYHLTKNATFPKSLKKMRILGTYNKDITYPENVKIELGDDPIRRRIIILPWNSKFE